MVQYRHILCAIWFIAYESASGKHQEFSLGETVYVRLDRQSFAKVKNKKWVKCLKEVIITLVLSETTYEVQHVASDGALGRNRSQSCIAIA